MERMKSERGSAGLTFILVLGGLALAQLVNENRATNQHQKEILRSNLAILAGQTNEFALEQTRSLIKVDAAGTAPVIVTADKKLVAAPGSGYTSTGGILVLRVPDPRPSSRHGNSPVGTSSFNGSATGATASATASAGASANSTAFFQTRVEVEEALLDATGNVSKVVLKATTETKQLDLAVTKSLRARIDVAVLNPLPPPPPPPPLVASAPPTTSTPTTSTTTTTGPTSTTSTATTTGPTSTTSTTSSPTSVASAPTGSGGGCSPTGSGTSGASSTTGGNTGTASATGGNVGTSATSSNTGSGACSTSTTGTATTASNIVATGTNTTSNTTSVTTANSAVSMSSGSASAKTGTVSVGGSSSAHVGGP